MFVMNSTSVEIWELLQEERTEQEIINALSLSYDIDKDIIINDVQEILTQMKNAGVIIEN
jgi:hypothetical protein